VSLVCWNADDKGQCLQFFEESSCCGLVRKHLVGRLEGKFSVWYVTEQRGFESGGIVRRGSFRARRFEKRCEEGLGLVRAAGRGTLSVWLQLTIKFATGC
jgi:hypothetical protein